MTSGSLTRGQTVNPTVVGWAECWLGPKPESAATGLVRQHNYTGRYQKHDLTNQAITTKAVSAAVLPYGSRVKWEPDDELGLVSDTQIVFKTESETTLAITRRDK